MHIILSITCGFLCVWRHFLKSPNFDGWFRNRRREMTQKLEALHLEALCEEVSGGGRECLGQAQSEFSMVLHQKPLGGTSCSSRCLHSESFPLFMLGIPSSFVGVSACLPYCVQDLQQRVQKHSEVETVDLVLKLKDKLVSINSAKLIEFTTAV